MANGMELVRDRAGNTLRTFVVITYALSMTIPEISKLIVTVKPFP